MNIPIQNLSLDILYGGNSVSLQRQPTITYSPGFLMDVSGYVLTRATANNFSGDIFMGNITFSNILLSTNPKNTFDFLIRYVPNYTKDNNIDNLSVLIKANRTTKTTIESGLKFFRQGSADTLATFNLSGSST